MSVILYFSNPVVITLHRVNKIVYKYIVNTIIFYY